MCNGHSPLTHGGHRASITSGAAGMVSRKAERGVTESSARAAAYW